MRSSARSYAVIASGCRPAFMRTLPKSYSVIASSGARRSEVSISATASSERFSSLSSSPSSRWLRALRGASATSARKNVGPSRHTPLRSTVRAA